MRRLTLLLAGGAVWLFLAAVPVFADGGPHIASLNSGSTGINADSCAACHRAHTAQASFLLIEEQPAMCITCHGDAGLGAATNVESGLQYVLSGGSRTGAVLGALRNGGFETARIASNAAYSVGYMRDATNKSFRTKVPVASTGAAVTSAHMPLTGPGEGEAWGNGPLNSGPGAEVEVECTTCHNPHGNGNFRILNPIPNPAEVSTTGAQFVATTGAAIVLDDSANVNVTRNYTVIQLQNGTGTLTAAQVAALGLPDTAGDYFRRAVPWDPQVPYNVQPPTGVTSPDMPNGIATFTTQISNWCLTCHSRYFAASGTSYNFDSGDSIFRYRHTSQNSSRNCATCHVAHGSNAVMTGFNSTHMSYPNLDGPGGTYEPFTTTANADSRLLKIDNRGTCQACHDPTGTINAGQVRPTGASAPVPYVP